MTFGFSFCLHLSCARNVLMFYETLKYILVEKTGQNVYLKL